MSVFDFKEREVVRVKVKLCNSDNEPLYKKFAIDPRITTYDVLQRLLTRAFELKSDFNISYLATDDYGEQFYLPMLSDWDLDAAILTASDPTLRLKVQIRPVEEGLEDWDIVVPGEVPLFPKNSSGRSASFLSQISQHVEKTVSSMQRAIGGFKGDDGNLSKPPKHPMNDSEFRNFQDNIGRIVMPREFRNSVYLGGVEPSLRKVVWRMLLNVYPERLNGKERMNFLQRRSEEYFSLKKRWKELYTQGKLSESHVQMIAGISVDVVRTDRTHSFYAGDKNHAHVAQLFDLLATYSIYHPSVGYSQGMSDLASPLLYVQAEEATAYICFCALMTRLAANFSGDGRAMITKLQHFHDLMVYYDPELARFLRERDLADMFFAHRWLVLELKREFNFDDVLRVLEVQWSSFPFDWRLPIDSLNEGVSLVEENFSVESLGSPLGLVGSPKDSAYLRLQSLRLRNTMGAKNSRTFGSQDTSLIHSLIGPQYKPPEQYKARERLDSSTGATDNETSISEETAAGFNVSDDVVESSLLETSESTEEANGNGALSSSPPKNTPSAFGCVDVRGKGGLIILKDGVVELPPPEELGAGNPLLLFLCLALVLEYREVIMKTVHEMFDFAIFYRKLNQRHNVDRILNRARNMYDEYLRDQEIKRRKLQEYPELEISL